MTLDHIAKLARIQNKDVNETFDQLTDSLEAIRDFIAAIGTGLAFSGIVTAVPGANQFTIPTLAGLGAGKFAGATNPYQAFVLRDAGGASVAPQGEFQNVTAYVTATGDFTTNAFTVAVAVGDEIIIIHPSLAGVITILADLAVPAVDAGTNILERDVIGNKGDQPNYNSNDASVVFSLMRYLRGAHRAKIQISGTAQAGSTAALLVDAANLVQGAGFWPGQRVLMIDGVNIWLSRPISEFNAGTDTITVDPAFPNVIGVGDAYIILSDYTPVVPTADIATNTMSSHIIGNKADAAVTAVGVVASIIAYIKGLLNQVAILISSKDRQLFSMDFWSAPQEEVAIPAVAATLTLPTVTVADLPAGATIVRAIAMVKFRALENINAGANKLDGATVAATSQVIQVRDDTPGVWRDAIRFVDDQFGLAASTREGGDVLVGDVDIAVEVDGNDGYEFQYLLAKADLLGINLNDCQSGLRIWYSV